ncbi:MAG: pyrrolo-quinoline quinone, partial [Lachnospiraceae bacterium]|nr:pyrrolo-quinoline quinone [Lachnospiraceae bacterium]
MKKNRGKKKGLLIGLLVAVLVLGAALAVRTTGILVKGVSDPLSAPVFNDEATETFAGQELEFDQKLLESGMAVSVTETKPDLFGLMPGLMVDGELVSDFTRTEPISFDGPYTEMEGIITFRGNNYRSSASYGIATLNDKEFNTDDSWFIRTGSLKKTVGDGTGEWSGSCWTGQPLIVRWKPETRQAMNLYEDKKAKDGLTEVIYATCDGNIYFLDLEDGSPTRDKISLGFPVKGTGSLYPNEVPLYFVGAGDSMGDDCARTFIVDLIKGEIIYEYGY